jgi:hypothetical protein
MFFLLRCAFWLGLVYLAMARDAGALPQIIFSPERIAASTAQAAGSACLRSPRRCASGLERATALAAGGRAPNDQSTQTLRAADLALPWRGKPKGG